MTNQLAFDADGTFTIVQFNDTQDTHTTDRRTIALMHAVLEDADPDLVVINGDVISGGPTTELEVKQALNNVVLPMQERGIPFAVTFGNHDEDSTPLTGLDETAYLEFLSQYSCCANAPGAAVTGTGNQVLPVRSAAGDRDAFAVWLLDSGRYAPERIAGQDLEGYPSWDWLRFDQVEWYARTSRELEQRNGALVPGLIFQHIALWEHRFAWFGGVDRRTEEDHARARRRHGIIGERNEEECPGPFNSGLFSALLHRGDVRGVFVGHDHTNTYSADYYGVTLGYGPGTGFGTYGLGGEDDHRLRGARVFRLTQSAGDAADVAIDTEAVFASSYGIDLTAGYQPSQPAPFPAGVR
ncbi:metallophosphoesterase family protein [Brachybacterium hainanense]|uniref:Metallophosphoesterase family protein n=1 Tax=Brachybacterium hainanense TaxID=1541174 RepID=A0ABV6RA79_9MICO